MENVISVIGGDLRVVKLVEMLAEDGIKVFTYGLEETESLEDNENVIQTQSLDEVLEKSKIIIGSIPLSIDGNTVCAPFSANKIMLQDIIDKIHDFNYSDEVKEEVYIETKYIGYINKELKEVEKLKKLEEKKIPKDIDYDKVRNLASEARQKLKEVRPITLGQASRISGVNPVDISILGIYFKKEYNKND